MLVLILKKFHRNSPIVTVYKMKRLDSIWQRFAPRGQDNTEADFLFLCYPAFGSPSPKPPTLSRSWMITSSEFVFLVKGSGKRGTIPKVDRIMVTFALCNRLIKINIYKL